MLPAVDICNLALSHIGDASKVTSIDPPDQSAQARLCAAKFPIALRTAFEVGPWSFASRRASVDGSTGITWSQLPASPSSTWPFAYVLPADCVNPIAVLPPGASDDYAGLSGPTAATVFDAMRSTQTIGGYVPAKFTVETDAIGTRLLLTKQDQAVLRYTALVSDTDARTPLFDMFLSWHLASMLAGPIIKGAEGMRVAGQCVQMAQHILGKASAADGAARTEHVEHHVPWIDARG